MKNQKMKLSSLTVNSFETNFSTENAKTIKGGLTAKCIVNTTFLGIHEPSFGCPSKGTVSCFTSRDCPKTEVVGFTV